MTSETRSLMRLHRPIPNTTIAILRPVTFLVTNVLIGCYQHVEPGGLGLVKEIAIFQFVAASALWAAKARTA